MRRDARVRRAQVLAGIIAGLILGTAHALVTHVASGPSQPAAAEVMRAPATPIVSLDGR